jgi:hypothetical protein
VSGLGIPAFDGYIGIDYSGAETPTSSLRGLRIYKADRTMPPLEVQPPPSPRKYWTRRGIAEWLVERLSEDRPRLVGIDHGFSFPLQYFETHRLPLDWPAFLDDFQRHWPTDGDYVYVDFVRDGTVGDGMARSGNPRWRRLTEVRTKSAKSVFHFDVQGTVAKSTHAGLPWLRYIRRQVGDRVHFGHSTAGKSRPCAQRSLRSIRRFGVELLHERVATLTSTTHILPPTGCAAPIWTVVLQGFSNRPWHRKSAR